MTDTIFFRLLDGVNRPSRLSGAVEALRENGKTTDTYLAEPASLRHVPGSPFAYWVSEHVLSRFVEFPPLETEGREARQGLITGNDFRFIRASWEVMPEKVARSQQGTLRGKCWAHFAKGGEYSPYYADVHLVVNWANDGKEIKELVGPDGKLESRPQNTPYYFRPGLTWSRRTQRGLSLRVYPEGSIFSDKGPVIFTKTSYLAALAGLTNSAVFHELVKLQMAFGSYYRSGLLVSQRLHSLYPPGVSGEPFEEGRIFPVRHKRPGERLL